MNIAVGIFLTLLLSVFFIYYIFITTSPESILDLGLINYLITAPEVVFGGLVGMAALVFCAIIPMFISFSSGISDFFHQRRLSRTPIKDTGQVTAVVEGKSHTKIDVLYAGITNQFNVDNRVFHKPLERTNKVVVFYDPKDKTNAYLDLISELDQEIQGIETSNTLFKLLEITPKFEHGENTYQLIGELHGSGYQGKKASLIYQLPRNTISQYSPGTLYPCVISGSADNLTISISA